MTETGMDEIRSEAGELLTALLAEEAAGGEPHEPKRQRIPLDEIELVPELFQPRSMSERHISDLVRVIDGTGRMDPLTVFQMPTRVILLDGHHRYAAFQRATHPPADIPVVYFEGTLHEAVLAAGEANSKAKLPMSARERMDYAWRLELLGGYSLAQIGRASGASKSQVAEMRKIRKKLGADAVHCRTWWQARRASKGDVAELMSDEEREVWKQEQAERYADALARNFSTKLAGHPEIAAMALKIYFGRKLPELVSEMTALVPKQDEEEMDF